MPTLRCLTESGIREFAADLQAMRNPALLTPAPEPSTDLLHDPRHSQPFPLGKVEVAHQHFANRRQFAQYIDSRFQAAGITHDVDVPGMWEWLTLFYFDQVCVRRPDGRWPIRDDMRYILMPVAKGRPHRHLLREPYMNYRKYRESNGQDADLILSQPLNEVGDVVESICSRERIITSTAAMRVARTLFYDEKSDHSDPITRGKGGLRDYCMTVQNLPSEFNLTELSEQTLLAMLPDQFDPLIQAADAIDDITDIRAEFGNHIVQPNLADPETTTLDLISIANMLQRVSQRNYAPRKVAVRNDNFRAAVIGSYENRCGISGIGLVHEPDQKSPQYEVQAAHIIPVSAGGRDTIDNGLALNRSIHWAFDLGMLWITDEDNLRVRVSNEVQNDRRNEWLRSFDGQRLRIPSDRRLQPNIDAINWHAQNVAMR